MFTYECSGKDERPIIFDCLNVRNGNKISKIRPTVHVYPKLIKIKQACNQNVFSLQHLLNFSILL